MRSFAYPVGMADVWATGWESCATYFRNVRLSELQIISYYFLPSTCALSAIFYGLGAYEMNLVARSLVPILYRRSSVRYQSISTYKYGNSAPYFFLASICTESRPYGPNLIIHELITAILQLAEEIGHELAPPLTLRNAPLPRTVSWVEDSVAFTPRCAAFLTHLNIPSGSLSFLHS